MQIGTFADLAELAVQKQVAEVSRDEGRAAKGLLESGEAEQEGQTEPTENGGEVETAVEPDEDNTEQE